MSINGINCRFCLFCSLFLLFSIIFSTQTIFGQEVMTFNEEKNKKFEELMNESELINASEIYKLIHYPLITGRNRNLYGEDEFDRRIIKQKLKDMDGKLFYTAFGAGVAKNETSFQVNPGNCIYKVKSLIKPLFIISEYDFEKKLFHIRFDHPRAFNTVALLPTPGFSGPEAELPVFALPYVNVEGKCEAGKEDYLGGAFFLGTSLGPDDFQWKYVVRWLPSHLKKEEIIKIHPNYSIYITNIDEARQFKKNFSLQVQVIFKNTCSVYSYRSFRSGNPTRLDLLTPDIKSIRIVDTITNKVLHNF